VIVEFFGPPAAGKTTLASALAATLEQNGLGAELIMSSRPAERAPIRSGTTEAFTLLRTGLLAPLMRAAKVVSAVPLIFPGAPGDPVVANLLNLLPPRNVLWSIRYHRYLSRLCRSWRMARASDRIVIFDQGFVSALSSLALLSRCADPNAVTRGLELIPRPDILICLEAPRRLLELRLRERLGRQGVTERLFELSLDENLQQIAVTRDLVTILQEQGWPMTHVSTHAFCPPEKVADSMAHSIGGNPVAQRTAVGLPSRVSAQGSG
jgi:thymidylate kinase